jgi:hypothetical protein
MKRLPRTLAAITLGSCSAPVSQQDGGYDAGVDGGRDAGLKGTPWGDAGCVLPSDFPWDASYSSFIADDACLCVNDPQVLHCLEEGGPRCLSWSCLPAVDPNDGGYRYDAPDGGLSCLC